MVVNSTFFFANCFASFDSLGSFTFFCFCFLSLSFFLSFLLDFSSTTSGSATFCGCAATAASSLLTSSLSCWILRT
eukprot:Pgem_evm1s2040